jgi:small-conductance mechanosensitive channel/CRP-like cAMP-binding protein
MTVPGYRRLLFPAGLATAAFCAYSLSLRANDGDSYATDFPLIGGTRYLSGIVAWLAAAWLCARLLDFLLHRAALSAPRPTQYPRLLSDLLHGIVFVLAAIAILIFVFRQQATGFIATSSVLIAVIGFALRYIISDVFSGIALNFDHPYRIGDWVEPAPGLVGRVAEITWRTTRLVTRDGAVVVVPNGLVATGRLVNYSDPEPTFRVNLKVSLDHRVPVDRAKQVLLAGAVSATRAFPNLRPDVLVQDCGESGVIYVVRFWVPDYAEENACRDAVLSGVLDALRHAGLATAAPRREIAVMRAERPDALKRPPLAALLGAIRPFSAFTPAELTELVEHLVECPVKEGGVVVRQGDAGSSLFFVAEGALEVRVSDGNATETVVDCLAAGDIFGEISLLTGEARHATIVALTAALLYEVRKEDLAPLLRRRPELGETLAAIMVERQQWNVARLRSRDHVVDAAAAPSSAEILRRLRSFFGLAPAS